MVQSFKYGNYNSTTAPASRKLTLYLSSYELADTLYNGVVPHLHIYKSVDESFSNLFIFSYSVAP